MRFTSMKRAPWVLLASVALLAACSSSPSKDASPGRTTTSSSSSTSTTLASAGDSSTTSSSTSTSTTAKPAAKSSSATVPPKVGGTVTVYAAQSLSAAFTEMGKAFEQKYAGASVKFNFAGSATLVTQIFQGAPADVFASADQANMDRLTSSGLMSGRPRVFTKNLLQIVVGKGNPKHIAALADLARSDLVVSLCAPSVPCGNYARQALSKAGVSVTPKTNESSVAGVIGRVTSGEADVGIVYVTDVLAAPKVDGVVIPAQQNVLAEYPEAALKDASNPVGAEAFMSFVESASGQAILGKYGFLPL